MCVAGAVCRIKPEPEPPPYNKNKNYNNPEKKKRVKEKKPSLTSGAFFSFILFFGVII